MMGQGFGLGSFGMMGVGSLMIILLIAAIGFLFYSAMKKQTTSQKNIIYPQSADSQVLSIAKSRLTNGEISVEEFEQIKKNLI